MRNFIIACFLLLFSQISFGGQLSTLDYFTEEYPPYNFKNDQGQLVGIAVDILEKTLNEMGVAKTSSDFKVVPWARGYKLTQTAGLKNVLFSTTRTEERETLFKWAGPIANTVIVVYAPQDKAITLNQDSDLKNYTFAAIRGDIGGLLLGYKGVPESKIFNSAKFKQVLQVVTAGRADMLAYEQNVAAWLMKKNGFQPSNFKVTYVLKESQLYYAFNLSVDDQTISEFQQALDKIISNKDFMNAVEAKYLK